MGHVVFACSLFCHVNKNKKEFRYALRKSLSLAAINKTVLFINEIFCRLKGYHFERVLSTKDCLF